jgi:NAD(P)-dependent dehydrogenase (short-subunit alcohol dehydrogenase family)
VSIVLITGSADGLGQMAARRLVDAGHEVVLHARSRERAREAADAVPGAAAALAGDLAASPTSGRWPSRPTGEAALTR